MGIMRWVAEKVRLKKGVYYGALLFYSVLTVILALGKIIDFSDIFSTGPLFDEWEFQWLWYVTVAGMALVTILVWFYYAPIVCDNLDRLDGAFRGEEYEKLYGKCGGWMQQFNWKKEGGSRLFKITYFILWALYLIFSLLLYPWRALESCGFGLGLKVTFEALNMTLIVLNFSSYYICIVSVYFLMRICKLEQEKKLDYIKQYPSSTYGFQVLNHTLDTIVLYFLLDSLFCSVIYFSFWQIVSKDGYKPKIWIEYWALLYVTFFLILFGLASWLFIILVSRIYLHRLHNHWKLRSYKGYEEMYRQARPESGEMDHILADIERLNQDKLTTGSWEMLISLLAIVANLATAVSIFSDWPQFPG